MFAAALVLTSIAATAIAVIALNGGAATPTRRSSAASSYAFLSLESPHVASSYSTYNVAAGHEGPGPAPTQPLTSAASFAQPIADYRRYAAGRLAAARRTTGRLLGALSSGDRAASERSWRAAYTDYLQLGAVYLTGSLAKLNERIDGTPGGLAGGAANPRFGGFHRIERGLWSGAATAGLIPYATSLRTDLAAMARLLPRVSVTPTEYATRAHEILEDAQRDLLSGAAVPFSGAGVLATAAGLSATEAVIASLHGLLHEEDGEHPPVGPPVEAELAALRAVLDSIAAAHGGTLPLDSALTQAQDERLQAALGGALEALAQVPPALEAEPAPKPIRIPGADARSEP